MLKSYSHLPVLLNETLSLLSPKVGEVMVDVTAGGGGHLAQLAEVVGEKGRVLALDRDLRAHGKDAAGGVLERFPGRVKLFHAPFSQLPAILAQEGITQVDGLLCDLGVSSVQFDEDERGFSFLREGPIDMRMDSSKGPTAYDLLASLSEKDLADVIFRYGEERRSRRIAYAIKHAWPLPDSTLALADLVSRAVGGPYSRTHKATRTFQALRIAVNGELEELETLLGYLPQILKKDARTAIISFHSLEDRLVKHAFKENTHLWEVLTKKPIVASEEELANNSRARSAKLRGIKMK